MHPPDPGYGYVAASRFKSKDGIYLFGPIRQSDWIPVHSKADVGDYHTIRGEESESDYDSDEEEQYARSYANYIERGLADQSGDSGSDDEADYTEMCRIGDDDELSDGCTDETNSINSDDEEESRRRTDDYLDALLAARGRPPREDYSTIFA